MADTLYDVLVKAFDEVGQSKSGTATGGSTTTVVDSDMGGNNSDFVNGLMIITYDAGGEAAAPENEISKVTAYTSSSGTFTVSPAFSEAVAAGDMFFAGGSRFPYEDTLRIINSTLRKLGPVMDYDESLTTSSSTTEYAIPSAVKGGLKQVWIPTLSTAGDYRWKQITDWYVVDEGTPAGTSYLIFRSQPESGKTLRLVYETHHPKVWAGSDTIYEGFHLNRVVAEVVYNLLKWQYGMQDGSTDVQLLNHALEERKYARKKYPIHSAPVPFKPLMTFRSERRDKYGPWLVN